MSRHSNELRRQAVNLFLQGYSYKAVASSLNLSKHLIRNWLYTYRALGKEALFVTEHKSYTQQEKLEVVNAVLSGNLTKPEAMIAFGIKSKTQINTWCRLFKEGGPDSLRPKKRGRPVKHPTVYASREEELSARIEELELELELQKQINALAQAYELQRQKR